MQVEVSPVEPEDRRFCPALASEAAPL